LDVCDDIEVHDKLVERGAKHGYTGLHFVLKQLAAHPKPPPYKVEHLHAKLAEEIEQGVDVNKLYRGEYPVHIAAQADDVFALRMLLRNSADKDAHDENGNTALLIASLKQCDKALAYLLSQNANSHSMNFDGQTALQSAIDAEYEVGIKLISEHEVEHGLVQQLARGVVHAHAQEALKAKAPDDFHKEEEEKQRILNSISSPKKGSPSKSTAPPMLVNPVAPKDAFNSYQDAWNAKKEFLRKKIMSVVHIQRLFRGFRSRLKNKGLVEAAQRALNAKAMAPEPTAEEEATRELLEEEGAGAALFKQYAQDAQRDGRAVHVDSGAPESNPRSALIPSLISSFDTVETAKGSEIAMRGDVVAQVEGFSAENEDVKYLVEDLDKLTSVLLPRDEFAQVVEAWAAN